MALSKINFSVDKQGFGLVTIDGKRIEGVTGIEIKSHVGNVPLAIITIMAEINGDFEGLIKDGKDSR